jgi:hypothetical protein
MNWQVILLMTYRNMHCEQRGSCGETWRDAQVYQPFINENPRRSPLMNALYQAFLEQAKMAVPYFRQYTYDQPMVVTLATNDTMRFMQKAMYKAIRHFVDHFGEYRHLMPVSDRVAEILALCRDVRYKTGTYRTDFLIDEHRQIKLIEITCRFALNGLLRAGFLHQMIDDMLHDKPPIDKINQYDPFFESLAVYFGAFSHVCLLKNDSYNEGRYLTPLFERVGYPVHIIEYSDIPQSVHLFTGAAVIGQLTQEELCALPNSTLERIIHSNLLNDLRTVFLIHDKRFFSVLGNDDFLNAAMSREEADRFRSHLVPTWAWHERRDLWSQAQRDKEHWIIKPRAEGRGIGVKAGCLTDEAEWLASFSQPDAADLTLQPYLQQSMFRGTVGDEMRHDYVVGTLLFFEDHFFGPGVFRASSTQITNQGDTRRLAHIVTDDTRFFDRGMVI